MALRTWLEPLCVTPFELIHNAKFMKSLLEQGTVLDTALTRVATIQARFPGQDQKTRRATLQDALNRTTTRAREAQLAFASLPRLQGTVDAVLAAAPGKCPTGDARYDLRVAIATELAELRVWPAKLEHTIELLRADRDERLIAVGDEVLADLLGFGPVLQELFGNAAQAPGAVLAQLCTQFLCDTATATAGGPNRLSSLNALCRKGLLPQTRAAVLDRTRRALRAPHPLVRGTPMEEAESLKTLAGLLLRPECVVGGEGMAEALTIRYSRRLEQGGASAFRRSIVGLAESLNDLFTRLHYLAAVSRTQAAERHMQEIVDTANGALANEMLVEGTLLGTAEVGRLRNLIDGAAAAIRASALPPESSMKLAGRLATLFDGLARQGRLLARLRQAEPLHRRRALRLAELACSGLLTEQGGLPPVRQYIMETVRQPGFQAELAQEAGNEFVQMEIRRLSELLGQLHQMGGGSGGGAAIPVPTVPAARKPAGGATVPTATTVAAPLAMPRVPPPSAPPRLPIPAGGTRIASTMMIAAPPVAPRRGGGEDRCPNCFADKGGATTCASCGWPGQSDSRSGIHLPPGALLHDRFRIGRLIGQGGFGATYLGWDDRLHVKVAVKEFYPSNLISRLPGGTRVAAFSDVHEEAFRLGLEKFMDEARMLARLRTIKEIVVVQDFFEENGTAYIIMELLQGKTLKRFIADNGGAVDGRRALGLLAPIMKALQAVHEAGLIHRDVSPDNIFITESGERKLLDFGAARQAAGQGAQLTVILKPGYAPPEQYSQDAKQGPWTDVYAMCATIYCAVTGKAPPDATSRFLSDTIPRPANLGAKVPPAFEKVLMSGLAMRQHDRPQSMLDLLRAFSAAIS
ncbi:serine/threonine protein kinase [Azospirillum sp. RWY-5-1]|uniref:Serine/threonine protein kinase n=2 Tax=Azospirillum oleiclasticum TaxID=2735135 RepID=A0ABX2T7U0_9PROT|nr:serine/threonine protein kinase [Azospirillum oleiclasticum]NYZ19327.1 serine/threonine protein kinase [Azospirillum oleiclasticum]